MQAYDFTLSCPECSVRLVDLGDELVCPRCGIVREKEIVEEGRARAPVAIDFTGQALGGYLGPIEVSDRMRRSSGFLNSHSTYDYLKLLSDFAGREDGPVYTCAKMIERVCEKLSLPSVVMSQSISIAKKLLSSRVRDRRITTATVSAFAIIAACKIEGVTSVSVKEIVASHKMLGRRVSSSSIIQLSLKSPIKTVARRAQDYVGRILARLSLNQGLEARLQTEGIGATAYFMTVRQTALEILDSLDENSKAGHNPCALAATSVYAAELVLAREESRNRRLTQRDVAECGDTAEYTVREQYRSIFMSSPSNSGSGAALTLPAPRAH